MRRIGRYVGFAACGAVLVLATAVARTEIRNYRARAEVERLLADDGPIPRGPLVGSRADPGDAADDYARLVRTESIPETSRKARGSRRFLRGDSAIDLDDRANPSRVADEANVVLGLTHRPLLSTRAIVPGLDGRVGDRGSAEALARRLTAVALDPGTPPQHVLKCAVAALVVGHDWGLSGLGESHSLVGYWRGPETTWASLDAIRWALSRGAYTETDLDEIAAILEALHSHPTPTRGVRLAVAEWTAWDAGWTPKDYLRSNFSPSRFSESVRADLEAAEAIVGAWNLPASRIPTVSEEITRRFESEFTPFMRASWWLGPRMRALIDLELARSAVAMARFRAVTGHAPTGLADCVPRFLPSLATDRPLRVRDGRVYDVGPDETDDGGESGDVPVYGRGWRFAWQTGAPRGDLVWEVTSSVLSRLSEPISKAELIGTYRLNCESPSLRYVDHLQVRDDGELLVRGGLGEADGLERSIGRVKEGPPLSLRMLDDDWALRRDPDGFVARSTKGEEIWLVRGDAEFYER